MAAAVGLNGSHAGAVKGSASPRGVFVFIARALPAAFLPLAVYAFVTRTTAIGHGLPLVLVALALGAAISGTVRNAPLAALTTIVTALLLLSAAYVQELQAAEAVEGKHWFPSADAALNKFAAFPDPFFNASAPAPTTLETMSIVLPCAFEGSYAAKTVESLQRYTKQSRLKEIIVVDDGSTPPLSTEFPTKLLRGESGALVRMLRHEGKPRGLIAAKRTGGNAATGDVIVFFDCHVKPREGWEEAFLRQMKRAGDHRTVVVPTITSLDPDTWEETGQNGAAQACYLLWNADFTWLTNPGRDVPIMSGGLLALSRRWWQETEGYDERMVAWGGENIDQSLRAWLCGGRIELAQGAYVAHMWRDAKNPKTHLKYPIPTEDVMRNKARAVTAWLDEFTEKTMSFPEYEAFVTGTQAIGDMTNFDRLKHNLKCAPFSAYIQRFSYVYVDSGLIPGEVFQVREKQSQLCLERAPNPDPPHDIILAPCAGAGIEFEAVVPELQLWHLGNRDLERHGAPCCSGLMNWNFLQCITASAVGTRVQTSECVISGHMYMQQFALRSPHDAGNPNQFVWRNGQGCLVPEVGTGDTDGAKKLEACSVEVEALQEQDAWRLNRNGECVTAIQEQGQAIDAAWRLKFMQCEDGNTNQIFRAKKRPDGLEVHVADSGFCLDSAGGDHPLVYPCYEEAVANPNQVWEIRANKLVWQGQVSAGIGAFCADVVDIAVESSAWQLRFRGVAASQPISLRSCTNKHGQRFQRHDIQEDSEGNTFLLQDPDTGKCLVGIRASTGALERSLRMGQCGPGDRWRHLDDREQLFHVAMQVCFDAGNEETPILYPCHQPKAQEKQRFRVLDTPGWVQMQKSWADNGRKRLFEKCIDHSPVPPVQVAVDNCDAAQQRGIQWERIGSRTPREFQLWQGASTEAPGSIGLGGGAEPP